MALTRAALRMRVVDNYRIIGPLPEGLSANWINDRIDDGLREISEATECIQGTCAILTTAGTRTYSITTDFIRVERAHWGTSQDRLERVTRDDLQLENGDGWIVSTGAVTSWYAEGHRLLGIYSIPITGSGMTVRMYGPRYAAALTADSSASELPTALDQAVAEFVCAELAGLDTKAPEGSESRFQGRYQRQVQKYLWQRPVGQGVRFVGPRNR